MLRSRLVLAYYRYPVTRTFLSYLLPAVVLFPLLFLLDSGIRKLIFPDSVADIETQSGASAPVVMVIFDEFPLISLLNRSREIDSKLFPKPGCSSWDLLLVSQCDLQQRGHPVVDSGDLDRNHSPAPPFSPPPVPGVSAKSVLPPLRFHDLQIQENVTQLNPWPAPTPFAPRFRLLWRIYRSPISISCFPSSWASRWLPPVTQTWKEFMTQGSPDPDRRSWEDFRVDWSHRADRFRLFVDSIRSNGRPGLYSCTPCSPTPVGNICPRGSCTPSRSGPGWPESWAPTARVWM